MNLKRLLPLLIVPLLLTACPSGANRTKNGPDLRNLPREIRSGEQGPFHVQGIAVDLERGYIYFSFTTKLLKMDFEGNLIGSVDGMTGHLGCLTMNPADGRVYGDTLRTDNDYQVLLAYDTKGWKRFEQPLSQGSLHKSGPAAPDHKYFVRTGNTSWGIQNLAYDPASGNCYAAVYKGKKSQYPNYSLFVIDGGKPARRELLQGFDTPTEGEVLSLVPAGKSAGGIYGWDFKWGTTGLCPLGGGYFYISQNARSKETKQQSSTVRLYRWTGDADAPFRPVE